MSYFGTITELGIKLADLVTDQSDWSQATFGADSVRGPIGALKHLKKEADEAIADPTSKEEYADCLLLILDASRRAGIKVMQLIEAAQAKMLKNKSRTWPTPTSDEPVEHVQETTVTQGEQRDVESD